MCTLRGSYGKSKGRCLIRVPTGPQHSTCKFPHQMALVKCPSAFRLPGSHKVWARSCDQSSTSTSSSSTPQHHLSSYPGIPTNPTMTRPKVECSLGRWHDHPKSLNIYQQVWPPHVQYIFDHCRGINLEWNWMNLNVLGCCVRRHEIVKLCDIVLLELVATTF